MSKSTVRTIRINDLALALPDSMSAKEIQQLAGFLVTLPVVSQVYCSDWHQTFRHTAETTVSLGTVEIYTTKAAAQAAADQASEAQKAKRAAEEAQQSS